MTALTWWLLALAVAGISFGLWQREARRRTLQHLSEMLDQAVAGGLTRPPSPPWRENSPGSSGDLLRPKGRWSRSGPQYKA